LIKPSRIRWQRLPEENGGEWESDKLCIAELKAQDLSNSKFKIQAISGFEVLLTSKLEED
jgi:hypothetical protein